MNLKYYPFGGSVLTQALDRARTPYGHKLQAPLKKKIWDFMISPTAETWDEAFNVVIFTSPSGRLITVLTVYLLLEPSFVSSIDHTAIGPARWKEVPNRFVVARGIHEATLGAWG
jgi:hypothetical protein